MTFQLDALIAIAFILPVAFIAILDVVAVCAHSYGTVVKPCPPMAPIAEAVVMGAVAPHAVASNDSEVREAARPRFRKENAHREGGRFLAAWPS